MVGILKDTHEDKEFVKHSDLLELFGRIPPTIVTVMVPYGVDTFEIPDGTDIVKCRLGVTEGHGIQEIHANMSGISSNLEIIDSVRYVDMSYCYDLESVSGCYGTKHVLAHYLPS